MRSTCEELLRLLCVPRVLFRAWTLHAIRLATASSLLAVGPAWATDHCFDIPDTCDRVTIHPLCSNPAQKYCCRPFPPAAAGDNVPGRRPGFKAKDFSLFKWNGLYHLVYILHNSDDLGTSSETRFGHDISKDLYHWDSLPPILPVRADKWDNTNMWAPFVIQRDSTFNLFYTGVSTSGKQSIGLATSSDLLDWQRRDTPIFSCANAPWTWCDSLNGYGRDFRDPFVMRDPDSLGRWIMYYSTRVPAVGDSTTVPGVALSSGDFTAWRDHGSLWTRNTNWWDNNRQLESSHLFGHNNKWFIAYTTNSGQPLEFQTGNDPSDSTAWSFWDRIGNLDCLDTNSEFASEYLSDPSVGGSGREYYCAVSFGSILIWQMRWWGGNSWGGDSTYFSLETPANVIAPSAVTDLSAEMGKTTAVLTWTAPGADTTTGTAAFYDLRYSTAPITGANFSSAMRITTADPDPAGTLECIGLSSLSSCTSYYFAIKTSDADSNSSAISNVASGETLCSGHTEYLCGFDDLMAQGGGGSGMAVENGILDLATTSAAATDIYALKANDGPQVDSLGIRLSLGGGNSVALDAALVALVPHADTVQAFVASRSHVVVGKPVAVAQITDSTGASISPTVSAAGSTRAVSAGTLWDITLSSGASAGSRQALLIELAGGGADDAAGGGGVQVLLPNGSGGWSSSGLIQPRRGLDACVLDSVTASHVRLRFNHDYLVGNVERIPAPQQSSLTWIAPGSAISASSGSVAGALSAIDGSEATLSAGGSITLRYSTPTSGTQPARQAFLLLRGRRVAPQGSSMMSTRGDQPSRPAAPFELHPTYPNPFSSTTTIGLALPTATSVTLEIYDASGRRVRTLLAGTMSAGFHTTIWDRRDDRGGLVPAGVYLYRIRAGENQSEEKAVVLR